MAGARRATDPEQRLHAVPVAGSYGLTGAEFKVPRSWRFGDTFRPDEPPVLKFPQWKFLGPLSPTVNVQGIPTAIPGQYSYDVPEQTFPWLLLAVLGISGYGLKRAWEKIEEGKEQAIFDAPRFTPFIITGRVEVSPTSIILTLQPKHWHSTEPKDDPYKDYWRKGIWSVEFKQPELQIARSYTPLPPSSHNTYTGELRFLIRREHKGEMSGYLYGLKVGQELGLRGPHSEFELPSQVKEVIFLAGGTGIAPALQVAHTLLKRRTEDSDQNSSMPRMHIVWANRRREDCIGGKNNEASSSSLQTSVEGKSPIVLDLQDLQRTYAGKFSVEYLVDEEGQILDQKRITQLVQAGSGSAPMDGSEKLLFVSGPEGFVNFFAGPKVWEGGNSAGQGTVGGLFGRIGLEGWRVWKL